MSNERRELQEFLRATWRGTTWNHAGEIGISFDAVGGGTIRVLLDRNSAKAVAGTIQDYLTRASHSERSSGSPSSDGSPQDGQYA